MTTTSLKSVLEELNRRGISVPKSTGIVCRAKRINGVLRPDAGWSQHSWANAIDLSFNGVEKQGPVIAVLESMRLQGFPVGTVIHCRTRADHCDHIHLEGSPAMTGVPPCAGGTEVPPGSATEQRDRQEQEGSSNFGNDFILGLFGLDEVDFADVGIRLIFGLIAVLAAGGTLLLVVNSFKGNVAGTLIGKIKNVVP